MLYAMLRFQNNSKSKKKYTFKARKQAQQQETLKNYVFTFESGE